MSTYYHNPENALKRANEFCELGKDDEALECLFDAFKNRKSRMVKHVHEMIINKLLELCVKHKNSQMAKDGLFNYRRLCQEIDIKSWEDSICKYLRLTESKVQSAEEAFRSLILNTDDLDRDATPEVLLKAVSSEGPQDRTERMLLMPWIKFLWECYRNCLDLLKNTKSVKLYHTVAKSAFSFCVKFSRKSELRKLCNALKIYSMHNEQNKEAYLKTDNVETHLICLDTGFFELESAIKMELWQDAFKAIENIHTLMSVSKNLQHSSKVMAHYYLKIALVFWNGKDYLFHAAANLRYFLIWKEQKKNLNSSDIVKLASQLMLSILAVPPTSANPTTDLLTETSATVVYRKSKFHASLLNLPKCPTRASLIKDAFQLNIKQYLPEELVDLFQSLENNAHELFPSISVSVHFIRNWYGGEFEEYIPLIQKVAVAKLLPLLSGFYTNVKMTKLLSFTGISQMTDLEVMVADSARRYECPLRIDHKNMCVHFPTDFNIFKNEKLCDELFTKGSRPDTHLKWLIDVHSALKCAVSKIHPGYGKNEENIIAEKNAQCYFSERESYRKSLLQRGRLIEKHKQSLEMSRLKKEEDERRRTTEKLLQYEAAEKERLLRETEERKLQRLRREREETKRKMFLEKMETFKKSVLGNQTVENLELESIDDLDAEVLFIKQVEQLNRERKQLDLRLRRQERNFDHFERAKRIQEMPLLTEHYEKQKETDTKMWNDAVKNKIRAACKKREEELRMKNRVLEIKPDLHNFLEAVKKRNFENYEREMKQFEDLLEEEKQKKLKERAEGRKQKRKEKWMEKQSSKVKKDAELKNRSTSKSDNKQNIMRKPDENQNVKSAVTLKKPVSAPIVDKIIFAEDVTNQKDSMSHPESKRGKNDSAEVSEGIYFSKDVYYYKRRYKSSSEDESRAEVFEKRASISSDLISKSKHESQRSDLCNPGDQRAKPAIFQSRNDTLLSWRTPWARKESYTSKCSRDKKEREIPQQSITILRRETRLETDNRLKDKKDSSFRKEKLPKSENQRSDIKHSCTPWAKLNRQSSEK